LQLNDINERRSSICEELEEVQAAGSAAAIKMVEHMLEMSASQCLLPVELDGDKFEVIVKEVGSNAYEFPELETEKEIAKSDVVENYIKGLVWFPEVSEEVKTAVACNLRAFHHRKLDTQLENSPAKG